jgi:predicted dinucleotide-binding enzyme
LRESKDTVAKLSKELSAELSALSNQQAKALADAIFVGMTAEEALEYDNRHARILEILRGDGPVLG